MAVKESSPLSTGSAIEPGAEDDLLDAAFLDRLRALFVQLRRRRRLRKQGAQQAPASGHTREFKDHRHYSRGDDFYLSYIDKRYRFYSHGLFESDDETLEEASEHKLESMWNGLELKPGMRLLDVGCPEQVHQRPPHHQGRRRDHLHLRQVQGRVHQVRSSS